MLFNLSRGTISISSTLPLRLAFSTTPGPNSFFAALALSSPSISSLRSLSNLSPSPLLRPPTSTPYQRRFSTTPYAPIMPVSDPATLPPAKRARTEPQATEDIVTSSAQADQVPASASDSTTAPAPAPAPVASTSTNAPKAAAAGEEEEYTGAADSATYIPADGDAAAIPSQSETAQVNNTSSPKPWENLDATPLPKSTSPVDFRKGLFLAPMVRSGSLPTRLMSLEYGADLVWGPEIVDRAIMGCHRVVDARTGHIDYIKDGKAIFSTHPVERPYVIFQLGSANVEWAHHATKLITAHDDIAGIDLNCGCPKPFSTIGGMGANLLSTPDLLCDVLKVMRRAAPPHVSVSCKIRLLPTKEETQSLVRKIISTGAIDNLTVHCRTKTMRPREPALPHRLEEVREVVMEMTGGKLPLCLNGDAWDAKEAKKLMEMTGVSSVMMARGAEANASCFRPEGNVSTATVVMPRWIRLAMSVNNVFGNTKFCLGAMSLKPSCSLRPNAPPAPGMPAKSEINRLKLEMSQAKDYESLGKAHGIVWDEVRKTEMETLLKPLREVLERREREKEEERKRMGVVEEEKEGERPSGEEGGKVTTEPIAVHLNGEVEAVTPAQQTTTA